MTCPYCASVASKILISSWDEERKTVRRDRICKACKYSWTTVELDIDQVEKLEKAVNSVLRGLGSEDDPEFLGEEQEP